MGVPPCIPSEFMDVGYTYLTPPPVLETVVIQSPSRMPSQSDWSSPRSSGLLQTLIHEAQALSSPKNRSCESSAHSLVVPGETAAHSIVNQCETEWAELSTLYASLLHLFFNEYNPPASGSLIASSLVNEMPDTSVKLEAVEFSSNPNMDANEFGTDIHFTRPDALLMSDWFEQSSECVKEPSTVTDAIATFLGGDFCNDYKQLDAESSIWNQSCGLDSLQ